MSEAVYKPVLGWGEPKRPVMAHWLTPPRPVVMESPCPYEDFDFTETPEGSGNATWSVTGKTLRATAVADNETHGFALYGKLRLLYDGRAARAVNVTSSLPLDNTAYFWGILDPVWPPRVAGGTAGLQFVWNGTEWQTGTGYAGAPPADIGVPFYRWSAGVWILGTRLSGGSIAGDWVELSVS